MAIFKHYAQLTAGSVAEAIMDTTATGQDDADFLAGQGRVIQIEGIIIAHEIVSGFTRIRIRRDATDPAPAAGASVLDATDNIMALFTVEAGQNGPIGFPGGSFLQSALAAGQRFYVTVEQPDGAAFAAVTLIGNTQ